MPRSLDPSQKHPMVMPDGTVIETVVHLNQVIDHPRMEIGDFSYYSDFDPVEDYAARIAPYLFPPSPEKLIIGKFCQFAHGLRIVTSSANHDMSGFSTYPFDNFRMGAEMTPDAIEALFHIPGRKGDTVIGNDVWTGMNAIIMPGVTIGDGAIIAAGSVVASNIPAYHIAGGNPAKPLRPRFDAETIEAMLRIRWWDWPVEKIEARLPALKKGDLQRLENE